MDNIETFHYMKILASENVGSIFEANFFTSVQMILFCVVMDNTETFHNKKMVVAEAVGLSFEADPFKSVQIIQGVGGHGQHGDVSPVRK